MPQYYTCCYVILAMGLLYQLYGKSGNVVSSLSGKSENGPLTSNGQKSPFWKRSACHKMDIDEASILDAHVCDDQLELN